MSGYGSDDRRCSNKTLDLSSFITGTGILGELSPPASRHGITCLCRGACFRGVVAGDEDEFAKATKTVCNLLYWDMLDETMSSLGRCESPTCNRRKE